MLSRIQLKFHIMDLHHNDGVAIKLLSEKFAIPEHTIYGWRRQYRKFGKDAFVGCGQQRPADVELRKLKRENERLKMQVELLKKVAAYQAQKESGIK